MTMVLVSSVNVGAGGIAEIEFASIPQGGKDLLLLLSSRSDDTYNTAQVRFNSSTTNYSARRMNGDGQNVFTGTDTALFIPHNQSTATAGTFSNSRMYISNYAGNTAKSTRVDGTTETNATISTHRIIAGLWNDTSAITNIKILTATGSLVQYSTASLYIIS